MTQKVLKILLADDVRLELEIEKNLLPEERFLRDHRERRGRRLRDRGLGPARPRHPRSGDAGMTGSDVCRNLKARPETRQFR